MSEENLKKNEPRAENKKLSEEELNAVAGGFKIIPTSAPDEDGETKNKLIEPDPLHAKRLR
jgi:hypothetical protein